MNWVICQGCGNVFDTEGTKTTAHSGCCPKCGLHYQGHYSVVHPILKPSPLAAKPIPERTCMNLQEHGFECSECDFFDAYADETRTNYCPNCGARVIHE